MYNTLKINMLGEFSLSYRDRSINDCGSRSKKVWTLLEYLITFREREVSQSELIELLWPENNVTNPANTLKTLLHRVRNTVAELGFEDIKKVIRFRRGAYSWNTAIPSLIDTEEFERLCQEAYLPEVSPEDKLEKLLSAAAIYRGDFLPNSSLEPWVVSISTYYHAKYIKVVCDAIQLLEAAGNYEKIVVISQKATIVDPYEEMLHYYLIRALIATGHQKKAQEHYEYVTNLFFTKFGINPSEELSGLYREIIKTRKSTEQDLSIIKANLQERGDTGGAFQCEYEIFKDIYHLEACAAARTGQAAYLCLITMTDASGNKPSQKVLNRNMVKLRDIIAKSLRRSDVFSRYSVSQYLIMLPTTNYENGVLVMKRIFRTYRRENPKETIMLRYSLQPLSPLELC